MRLTPRTFRFPLLLALPLLAGACSQWDGRQSSLNPSVTAAAVTPDSLYAAGIDSMRQGEYQEAIGYFDGIEREHPYSTWATNARLMAAYSDYMRNRYTEAIGALDRFIQLHPAHRDIAYAYYLRSLCYYEQIVDAERDQRGTEIALNQLQEVINRFPDTPYARDARLKMDLARDHLAGREMNIGRFYQSRGLYTAAIGRFRRVVDEFQTTNHVPEALHRLTEIYLALGLTDEARKSASVLGYNYPGSSWYQDSYALLADRGIETDGPAASRPGFFARAWNSVF
ncbi:outer membrane protein assembly factor BamD [Teichococcus vastitatis]|uniref:Outer membrane protein assembly factor BamD n=1 Tax=Teichococcus vastitatis TaxID=2307076 RepID=A0ABS9W4M9_9PROT|nr:outer membrane protein assembly factor BamD [Pseudoroseomonas vastitatis]MCI0754246.1 outer membrane protein assembly factor BamD [Pseudoroseomonas vastitatis]